MRYPLLISLLTVAMVASMTHASVPEVIHYQGRLMDAGMNPATDSVDVDVKVFTVASGGTAVWTQEVGNVSVTEGHYAFDMGNSNLTAALTSTNLWLEISLDDEVMSARQQLVAVPFALHAKYADRLQRVVSPVPVGMIMMWAGTDETIPDGWVLCDGANGTPDLRNRFVMGESDSNPIGTTGGANTFTMTEGQLPAHTHTATSGTAGSHSHSASTGSAGNHNHVVDIHHAGNHNHRIYGRAGASSRNDRVGGAYSWGRCNNNQDNYSTRHNPGNHRHSFNPYSGGSHTHTITINSGGAHTHAITVSDEGSSASIENRPESYTLAYIMKI